MALRRRFPGSARSFTRAPGQRILVPSSDIQQAWTTKQREAAEMTRRLLRGAVPVYADPAIPLSDARQSLVLLDDFADQRENNFEAGPYFFPYNRAVNNEGPDQTTNSVGDGLFRTNVPGWNGSYVNIWYLNCDCAPYTEPDHWLRGHIKSGTWSSSINRMSQLVRVPYTMPTVPGPPGSPGGGRFNIGTYTKPVDNFSPGAEGTDPQNGHHWYHSPVVQLRANRWAKLVITNCPIHERGNAGNVDEDPKPEYFHQLTRVYWTEWEWNALGAAANFLNVTDFARVELYRVDNNDDFNIRDLSILHTTGNSSGRYEVGWQGRKNVVQTYDVRYRTDGVPFSSFSGGTLSGDHPETWGDAYCACFWVSPTMDESPNGFYVAIRLQGETDWSQIYLPYQLGPENTAVPTANVS